MSSTKITIKAQKRTVMAGGGRYTVAFPKMKFKICYNIIDFNNGNKMFHCYKFIVISKEKMMLTNSVKFKGPLNYTYKVCLGSGGIFHFTEESTNFFEKSKNLKIHKNKFIKNVASLFFNTKFDAIGDSEKYFEVWQNEGLQTANKLFEGILDKWFIYWNKPSTWAN
jgi:hypothetical protein